MKGYVCSSLFSNFCSNHSYGQVPFQANSSDCGIFALLFVLHLRHGSFNHINVPVRFRMEMKDQSEGKVGELIGVRLSLVEFILSLAKLKPSKSNISGSQSDPICLSD